ncbi:MAG: CoA-binding protein [Tabrizicola sp.]|nr:CoA-binding protein [Tabrizicola sp.]
MPSDDTMIRDILTSVKTIAVVGWSPKPERPSNEVAAFLARRGYRVIPVNPGQVGQMALGEEVRAALAEAGPVDMVDIFRRSEEAGTVVDQAIAVGAKVVWMQLGVVDEAAAARARAAGLQVVMNRCPAIEIPRLGL